MVRKRTLIVGDGAAGTTAAQVLRRAEPSGLVTVVSDDPHPPYFRAALTNYLLGELREEQLASVPPNFYQDNAIQRIRARAIGLDPSRGQLWLAGAAQPEAYDRLLVATGSRARTPPFPGGDLPGVLTMRTLDDVRKLLEVIRARGVRRAVVVGGGPLGLEWAHGLRVRNVAVTLLMREPRFLPGALDDLSSDLVRARLRQGGVEVRAPDEITAARAGRDGAVAGVVTRSGAELPCELVAVAIGVLCNTEWLGSAAQAGNTRGLVVDETMRTTAPNVWAAGDCAEFGGKVLQLWEPARLQGRVAAMNMTGSREVYRPDTHYFATRLFDLDFASVGAVSNVAGADELTDYPRHTGRLRYLKLIVRQGRLVGALMLGQRDERVRARGRAFKQLIDDGTDVSKVARELLDPGFDLLGWLSTEKLMRRPEERSSSVGLGGSIAPPAKMRATAALSLASFSNPGRVAPSATKAADAMPVEASGGGTPNGNVAPRPLSSTASAPPPPIPARPQAGGTLASAASPHPSQGPPQLSREPLILELSGGMRWTVDHAATIGRDPSANVRIDDPLVAMQHAHVAREANGWVLRAVTGVSGVWLNGNPVIVPALLANGDRIVVGRVELVARWGGA